MSNKRLVPGEQSSSITGQGNEAHCFSLNSPLDVISTRAPYQAQWLFPVAVMTLEASAKFCAGLLTTEPALLWPLRLFYLSEAPRYDSGAKTSSESDNLLCLNPDLLTIKPHTFTVEWLVIEALIGFGQNLINIICSPWKERKVTNFKKRADSFDGFLFYDWISLLIRAAGQSCPDHTGQIGRKWSIIA